MNKLIEKFRKFSEDFKEFFRSNDFKKDPYGWMTNQAGHVLLSLIFSYLLTYLLGQWYWIPVSIGWILWELRQFNEEGKNEMDLVADLYFEILGVVGLKYPLEGIVLLIVGISIGVIKRWNVKKIKKEGEGIKFN